MLRLPLHSNHGDFIAFELGDVRFNIGTHDRVEGPSKDPFRFMPHLGVDDIHREADRLGEAGVEFHPTTGARELGRLGSHVS